jgi:hypothetical protein
MRIDQIRDPTFISVADPDLEQAAIQTSKKCNLQGADNKLGQFLSQDI